MNRGRRLLGGGIIASALVIGFGTVLISGTAGCAMFKRDPDPEMSPWYVGPEEILWDATLEVVSMRFRLGDVDRSKGTFKSLHMESLSPFKGEGRRRQVDGSIKEDGNRYRIELQVWVETNMEIDHPTSSDKAKWKKRHDDPMAAQIMLAQIERLLRASGSFTIGADS